MGIAQLGGGGGCGVRNKCFPAGWNVAAKPCDFCKSAAALLFCRVDAAFMCMACDAKVHGLKTLGLGHKHERVWMCEVCEQAPAAVTCKADAAALCVTCDSDIHCANPLARRHERVPVVPFYETAESVIVKSTAATLPVHIGDSSPMDAAGAVFASEITNRERNLVSNEGYNIADSWISSDLIASTKSANVKPMEFLLSDNSDQFLDFDGYQISSQPYCDSLVPVQTAIKLPVPAQAPSLPDQSPENQFEMDFKRSNINPFHHHISYSTPSLSHSISSSSMDVGVVPDGSSLSEISYPFARSMLNVDLNANQGSQVVGMDREARVLRYKEKRKNRKFEKTIRYASRKAYAETRPRIKGRFAKRSDSESDIEQFFDAGAVNFMKEANYGVVPSFGTWDRFN